MKNVLITGASRGIGKECARAFAKENYRVFINYNKSEKEALDLAEEINGIAIKCDVSNSKDIKNMFSFIETNYGGIDVLINNAGISKIKLLTDTTEEEYNEVFDTNMKSVYLVTKSALPYMINKKMGKIINISSMWGITGASMEVIYSASKAAVIGFTKALSKELGPSNINVNCIAPGVINTDMNKHLDEETLIYLSNETPLMRLGKTEDVAGAALFLASDNSSFITGQVLSVDGGITI